MVFSIEKTNGIAVCVLTAEGEKAEFDYHKSHSVELMPWYRLVNISHNIICLKED